MIELQKEVDLYHIGFEFIPTKKMFISRYKDGRWEAGKIVPFGSIELSPAACVLNYGQGIFEGMKAYCTPSGEPILFRPEENAKRMNYSAERLLMPEYDEKKYVEAVTAVVKDNREYLPPNDSGGALYIRPLMIGSGPILGIAPAKEYLFIVFCCPVGPYFPKGFEAIDLKISKKYTRASKGGTGFSKTCSNYAGTMKPAKEAKEEGFAQILYLDSVHMKYISEVGAANFCAMINDTLCTPSWDGTILEGITLKSVFELADKKLRIKTEQRDIPYDVLFTEECTEAFCTGTAAVITPIGSISWQDQKRVFNDHEPGEITRKLYELLTGIQKGEIEDEFGWTTIIT